MEAPGWEGGRGSQPEWCSWSSECVCCSQARGLEVVWLGLACGAWQGRKGAWVTGAQVTMPWSFMASLAKPLHPGTHAKHHTVLFGWPAGHCHHRIRCSSVPATPAPPPGPGPAHGSRRAWAHQPQCQSYGGGASRRARLWVPWHSWPHAHAMGPRGSWGLHAWGAWASWGRAGAGKYGPWTAAGWGQGGGDTRLRPCRDDGRPRECGCSTVPGSIGHVLTLWGWG